MVKDTCSCNYTLDNKAPFQDNSAKEIYILLFKVLYSSAYRALLFSQNPFICVVLQTVEQIGGEFLIWSLKKSDTESAEIVEPAGSHNSVLRA